MKKITPYILAVVFVAGIAGLLPQGAYAAVAIIQTADPAGVTAASTIATYSSVSIGTASSGRIIAVVVGTELNSSTPTVATIDSGGGAVTMTAATSANQGSIFSQIFYLPVPTGTTATITVKYSSVSPSNIQNHIAVYSITGAGTVLSAQGSDPSTDMDVTSPLTTGSVTIPAGGGFLGVSAGATDAVGKTWANATEVLDEDAGGFQFGTATSTAAGTVTVTVTGGTNGEDGALSYVIFKVPVAPTVSTDAASTITATAATINGTASSDGGATITARGFATSTVSNLSSSVSTSTLSGTTGAFSQTYDSASLTGNTTYYFRAYATNSAGDGLGSILNFLTLPGVPTINAFTNSVATSTTVNWSAPTGGASTYKLLYCNGSCVLSAGLAVTSTTTNTLVGNTTYTFKVLGTNTTGDGTYTASSTLLTVPNVPGTPTYTSVTGTSMTVSWVGSVGSSTSYKLERCITSTATCTLTTGIGTVSQAVSGLANNTSYDFAVLGTNATGDGLWSATSTQATPAAPTVTSNAADTVTATSANINGNITATGGENATVEGFATSTDSAMVTGVSTSSFSGSFSTGAFSKAYSNTSLTGNTTYYFRAYATNSAGDGLGSILNFLTLPGVPTINAFTNSVATSTTVNWSAPTGGASTYKLLYCNGSCVLSSGLAVTSTTTNPLVGNTTYTFKVLGTNTTGDGTYTASSTLLTVPNIPGTPTYTSVTGTSMTVNWVGSVGSSTSYKLERCITSTATCTLTTGIGTVSQAVSGLANNTSYDFAVLGTNATGDGLWSATSTQATPAAPTVTSNAADTVTATSANINGNITATGGENATVEGFATSTDSAMVTGVSTSSFSGSFSTGAFSKAYSNTSLTGNTTYYFRAYATNSAGDGLGSILNFLTLPGVPTINAFTNSVATSTTVNWSAPTGGASTYKLLYCNGSCVLSSGLAVTSTTTNPLVGNTTYTFKVLGTNTTGDGTYTASSTLLTVPNIPGTPTYTSVTGTSMTVNWVGSVGSSTSYKLERCITSTATCTLTTGIGTVSQAVSGLANNTSYDFAVLGTNATGDGLWSATSTQVTSTVAPTVTTQAASSVTATTATLNGNITATGGASATVRGFAYGTVSTLATVIATTTDTSGQPFSTGAFTGSVSGLTCNTVYYARAYATNSAGDGLGSIQSFTTSPCIPTVTSNAADTVTATSANINGNITATGGENATARGFATSTNSTLSSSVSTSTFSGSFSTGAFSATYSNTSLTGNTTYYFRAYATNSAGDGLGSILNFLTLPGTPGTPTYTSVAQTSLTVNWSAPTGDAATYNLERCVTSTATCTLVTGIGALSQAVSSLAGNTSYDFAVQGVNATGAGAWSATSTQVTSAVAPTVTTNAASSVTTTSATLNGTISATGGADASQSGFAYSTDSTLVTGVSTSTLGAQTGTASFNTSATSLSSNTTYYVRAYATNSAGTSYGSTQSFVTGVAAPTVTTSAANSVNITAANLNGSVTATGGANATTCGFSWGTGSVLSGGDSATTTDSTCPSGTGSFTKSLSGLVAATTYYFRAYATNSGGTGYGSIVNFTTTASSVIAPPTVRQSPGAKIKIINGVFRVSQN